MVHSRNDGDSHAMKSKLEASLTAHDSWVSAVVNRRTKTMPQRVPSLTQHLVFKPWHELQRSSEWALL
jgi:hypothetical protein